MKTLLIDYGMGNLGSARRALEECGADVLVSEDPGALEEVDRFVLPGVGSFGDGMEHLNSRGWPAKIKAALRRPHMAMLGICLGMQLLAETGFEGGESPGLGLIPGVVTRLDPPSPETRIPHVGWNEVHYSQESPLFSAIPNKSDFYFVHSFHFMPVRPADVLAYSPYCGKFVSAIGANNVFGVQFHPEKSARPGLQMLRNFLNGITC